MPGASSDEATTRLSGGVWTGSEWPDDGLRHRVAITVEIPSGPGIEIVAAELLLDLVQRLGYQALAPTSVRLQITTIVR